MTTELTSEAPIGYITWKEYQKLHKFKETDYSVKEREWKLLDPANPAFAPALPFGGRDGTKH